jgi:hypothetical protein
MLFPEDGSKTFLRDVGTINKICCHISEIHNVQLKEKVAPLKKVITVTGRGGP